MRHTRSRFLSVPRWSIKDTRTRALSLMSPSPFLSGHSHLHSWPPNCKVPIIFLCLLSHSLGHFVAFLAISRACGAAAKLFATIDRVPLIDSASPEGLKPTEVNGRVELDHVKFSYPSRLNVPILKDLSIEFEAGKTTALVGASGSGKRQVSCIERILIC